MVQRSGESGCAIWAERHGGYAARMPGEAADDLPSRQIPEDKGAIGCTREGGFTVGTERHGDHRPCMSAETTDGLACCYIPQNHCLVIRAGEGRCAIRAERHGIDGSGIPGEVT